MWLCDPEFEQIAVTIKHFRNILHYFQQVEQI
jgi:hypothetical protein